MLENRNYNIEFYIRDFQKTNRSSANKLRLVYDSVKLKDIEKQASDHLWNNYELDPLDYKHTLLDIMETFCNPGVSAILNKEFHFFDIGETAKRIRLLIDFFDTLDCDDHRKIRKILEIIFFGENDVSAIASLSKLAEPRTADNLLKEFHLNYTTND